MADEHTKPSGAGASPGETPRIHIDADWKREAQAEKERLAREAEQAAAPAPAEGLDAGVAAAAAGAQGTAGAEAPRAMPPASFATLVQMLATQAAIFLSDQEDPETGESFRHLDLAKHNIDLLSILEEKTRGNLTDDERRLLDRMLYELRMAYVSAAS